MYVSPLQITILTLLLYSRNTNISRNIIKHNIRRTNTLLYQKNISLTLYSRKGDVCCVWKMSWKQGQTAILTQVLLATIAALLPHIGWGCSTVGIWGLKAFCLPVALTSAPCLQLTRTVCPPASTVLPLIYTGASLDWQPGRGSYP